MQPTIASKTKIIGIEWYLPHYTPSIKQQKVISKHILSKTELQNVERTLFMEEVKTRFLWTFELGTQ